MLPSHPPGVLAALAAPDAGLATLVSDLTVVGYFVAAEALAASATFAEVALEHHSRARVLELAEARGRRARAEALLARSGALVLGARILRFLGKALIVVGVAFLALRAHLEAGILLDAGHLPWGALGLVVAVAFAVNFLGNDLLVPTLAQRHADRFVASSLGFLAAIAAVSAPLRVPLVLLVRGIFRVRLDEGAPGAREEVLETVEEGEREGTISTAEADMIESIIDLPGATVRDVLIPRADVSMIRGDATLLEAVRFVRMDGHSRVPVYGVDRDDVLGVLYARDLIDHWGSPEEGTQTVRSLMREAYFVPETKRLLDLLAEMRTRKAHLAVVLNEFRGTEGIVTIEDLLEEIVGEIQDEYDEQAPSAPPGPAEPGPLLVDGRTPVEDLNRAHALGLPEGGDYETVGGLLMHRLGKVPRAGDRLTIDGVSLTVTEADERTVKRLKVEVHPQEA